MGPRECGHILSNLLAQQYYKLSFLRCNVRIVCEYRTHCRKRIAHSHVTKIVVRRPGLRMNCRWMAHIENSNGKWNNNNYSINKTGSHILAQTESNHNQRNFLFYICGQNFCVLWDVGTFNDATVAAAATDIANKHSNECVTTKNVLIYTHSKFAMCIIPFSLPSVRIREEREKKRALESILWRVMAYAWHCSHFTGIQTIRLNKLRASKNSCSLICRKLNVLWMRRGSHAL